MATTAFFGHGTLTNVGQGLTPASGTNNGYTASSAQTWLRREFIQVLEENLYFYRCGTMETIRNGYLTHSFPRMDKTSEDSFTETTGGGGLLSNNVPASGYSVGVTPGITNQPVGTISVNPRQFAIRNVIADMMTEFSVLEIVRQGIMHFANAAARRIDKETQKIIYTKLSANTDRIYFVDRDGTVTETGIARYNDAKLKGANVSKAVMTVKDIAAIVTKLKVKSAPPFDATEGMTSGFYPLLVHTFVAHDIMTEAGQTGFVNIFAQTPEEVKRIAKGYVGTVYGMSIMETPFITTYLSVTGDTTSAVVYPSYAIARGLYGVLKYRFNTYFNPASRIDDSDPLAQRTQYGVKFSWNAIVLDEDCGVLAYSAATGA